ncbi:TSC22 domain family protein 1-like isoform X2 [Betta splendens]|uniref:TSC22 domain family protein 1-like isoform X2 n=1 Tax=Betta splendens TaxID=158456 RepID=A0A8M1HCT0_BETSP|nr:TSC22 domain family protein 1-like isoform X2 [Betta splendens]
MRSPSSQQVSTKRTVSTGITSSPTRRSETASDSSSSNSLNPIDNKIEQAMDLVKSHLLLAVREQVELLRERIRDLQEKNQQLERENRILRALTHSAHSAI